MKIYLTKVLERNNFLMSRYGLAIEVREISLKEIVIE